MSEVKLLAGLITIDGLKVTTTTVSDGTKSTTSGSVFATDVKFGGQDLGLGGQGVSLGGTEQNLPSIPDSVANALEQIGLSFDFAPVSRSVDGATSSLTADGLVLSVDTQPLKTALNLGGIVKPLQDLIEKIPKIGNQIAPLLGLGPKIVFLIGDAHSQSTAAPAYSGGPIPGGGSTTPSTPGSGTGGTSVSTGGGVPISNGGGPFPTSVPSAPGGVTTTPTTQPAAFSLPGLSTIPRLVILGSLLLALAGGWLYWAAGRFIFGAGRTCAYGLSTGVPDLRKG
jgi:hypothetical protein